MPEVWQRRHDIGALLMPLGGAGAENLVDAPVLRLGVREPHSLHAMIEHQPPGYIQRRAR